MSEEETTKTEEEAIKAEEEAIKAEELLDEKDGFVPLPEMTVIDDPEKKETSDDSGKKPEETLEEEREPLAFKPTPIKEDELKEDDLEEIVHMGQVHRISKEKLKELAQKGFDYDSKVGPHGKIARMIEANPAIAKMVQDTWDKKDQPKDLQIKSLDDYEDENEWLKANLQTAIADNININEQPRSQAEPQVSPIAQTLMMRDPQHFKTVMDKMPEYLSRLTVENYKRVDTDLSALCEFYDYVKEQEISVADKPTQKPSFKVRSMGTAPKENDVDYAWKIPNKDFEKQLAKIKGYT